MNLIDENLTKSNTNVGMSTNTQIKRNLGDIDHQQMAKYSELLTNILNYQDLKQPNKEKETKIPPTTNTRSSSAHQLNRKKLTNANNAQILATKSKFKSTTISSQAKQNLKFKKSSNSGFLSVRNKSIKLHQKQNTNEKPAQQQQHEENDFQNLNLENYIQILKYLFNKLNIENLNEKNYDFIVSQIDKSFCSSVNELKTTSTIPVQEPSTSINTNDLENKLELMKIEINELKKQLNSNSFQSTKEQFPSQTHTQQQNQHLQQQQDKLIQLQKQIINLTLENQNLLYENDAYKKQKLNLNDNQILIKKLNDSNEKCKSFEMLLKQKQNQIEQYINLFKEISSNVNTLIYELENKNMSNDETKSIIALKQQLVKLNKENNNVQQQVLTQQKFKQNVEFIVDNNNTSTTTSSDTLIDADSSFDSLKLDLLKQSPNLHNFKQPQPPQSTFSSLKTLYTFNNNDLKQNVNINNNFEDYDDEHIVVPLDDLSITTIQTTTDGSGSIISNSTMNSSVSTLKSSDDEQFRDGLKELDKKISRVKKLLDSMKS